MRSRSGIGIGSGSGSGRGRGRGRRSLKRLSRWWLVSASTLLLFPATLVAAQQDDAEAESEYVYVRVDQRHTNVHAGASTARPVLVLAPEDTRLRVLGRRGEWLEVELKPELRETGIVVRWYENEERGFVHESTVTPVEEPVKEEESDGS